MHTYFVLLYLVLFSLLASDGENVRLSIYPQAPRSIEFIGDVQKRIYLELAPHSSVSICNILKLIDASKNPWMNDMAAEVYSGETHCFNLLEEKNVSTDNILNWVYILIRSHSVRPVYGAIHHEKQKKCKDHK